MEIVVIGNGVAGNAACSAIRSKNKKAKLTLIAGEAYPFYSPCILTYYISKNIKRSNIFLKSLKDYKQQGIDALLGDNVEGIDPKRKRVFLRGRDLPFDKLILATGSQPVIPPIEGVQKRGVRVLKSLRDADHISRAQGKKAVIVGSGPIGVELAVALRKRNWEVCLVEVLDWILPNLFDEKGSHILRGFLERQGIEVLTGERVLAIKGGAHAKEIVTSRSNGRDTDMVVLVTGMQPSTEIARDAGIEIGNLGGILTNDEMETNIRDIYACGDCVEGKDPIKSKPKLSLLWPHAERQGKVAGFNSVGDHRLNHWSPDVVNLDIFGTFAGSIGQPARVMDRRETDVLEKAGERRYCCLIISEERLVGAQFIGDCEGMGTLFSLMGRNYGEIKRKIMGEEGASPLFWYQSAKEFFPN